MPFKINIDLVGFVEALDQHTQGAVALVVVIIAVGVSYFIARFHR